MMSARLGVTGPALVGRPEELGVVAALLRRACSGESGALLISGDVGVGKTALVQRACADVDPSALVLAGSCLPLTSMTVPFLAIRSAMQVARRESIPLPDVMGAADSPAISPIIFDAWLDHVTDDRPVVLAIDDLHWADQSTLDVLMYVLAGPASRRLSVIATIRSRAVNEGHPLQHWLAHVRRLPRVEQMTLEPIDRISTGDQISDLLGAPPHQSLVQDVFTHTRGNPYLNQLLVDGLPPESRRLPADLPADLSSAVLLAWSRLPASTLELARILAVGGAPMRAQDLSDIAGTPDSTDVQPLLREAVDAGTLDHARDGTYWFHHPMSAEVLEQSLDDDERRRWHAAFAHHGERALAASSSPAVEMMVAVADHHDLAGHQLEAYRWSLRASEAAGSVGGNPEMLRLLRRAVDLARILPDVSTTSKELLRRLTSAAAAAGAQAEELRAVDELIEQCSSATDPLLVAELLVRRGHLRFSTGHSFFSLDDLREAKSLSSVEPDSWQHAFALAELAHACFWHDDPEAQVNAERALVVARAAGNARALSYALTANAILELVGDRGDTGAALANEAVEAAVAADDYWAFCHATLWEGNCVDTWASRAYADHLRRRREQLAELAAPHTYIAWLSSVEAMSWLAVGDWRRCLARLRVVLGSDPGPFADVSARLVAARLAAWQGSAVEAQAHMVRVEELFVESSTFLNHEVDAVRAEVHLAAGRPRAAYEAAIAGATLPGAPPTMCEWLMPLATRALADLIRADLDAGLDPGNHVAQLDELTTRFPSVIRDVGETQEQASLQTAALDELYAAEVGRARLVVDNDAQWERAADACHEAMLAWEETYACWRAAESLLMRDRHQRPLAAAFLRRGLALALELRARPIQLELEALAASARIPLDPVTLPQQSRQSSEHATDLPGLTTREREILAHVVAGRTYAEIAREMVISEKTVSSHISNLLRKTGTANRVELSRLATRSQGSPTRPS